MSIQVKINNKTNLGRVIRRIIRFAAGVTHPYPVVVVPGNAAPALKGRSYHYTNKSGDIIYHPSAYKRAWGKPIYHHSTLRVEVGKDWFNANFILG